MSNARETLSEVPEEELLVLYANGDRAAARALTELFAPKAFAFAQRLLSDRAEAEDVAQEAMLRLWKIAPEWRRGEAKVSTWLYQVTRNLCTDRLRKRRGVGLDEIAEPLSDAKSADEVMQAEDRAKALQLAMETLPERQRAAIVLRHFEGLSNPEIADVLEISTEAVESLTARGKRALAKLLSRRRDELGYTDA
ncbi:RNA polymerase sigma factor [Halocynthiibacter sp. C4]|uniref:RNA polymerase sigma factor n=1 Tax=Halocynthiibacter sp. C4 TaxID=2992758 RepID=UPI00237AA8DB|nr:RNA polymerase sigma factor [Halocynthiibacter sp. C4]MDE0588990.1 RNA polymerase sigma factor [Halocynthiibacter sp. C4]